MVQPGRIPIPDFKQESSAKEVGAISPPPKVQRIKSEQWMTQTTDSQPLRSELPRETKRLSRERTQFLFTEDVKAPTNEQSRLPNKVLIPDFNQANNEREIGQVSPVPKVNKIKAEHWITQTSVVEMPQSEPTTSFGRLTYEQTQFLNTEETKETTKVDGTGPGRIPIPDFKQESSAKEVGAISPPPKVQRIKSEQWMTQTTDSQPLRSELPRETKRLSRERTQFLFTEDVKAPINEQSRLPNKVLIPDFNQANNEREIGQVSPVPKVNKIKAEHWITQTSVVEMPQSEPTTSFGRLTYEQTQFLNTEETKETTKVDGTGPGRIPIPDFKQESSAKEVGAISPPPKVQRIKSEQWMTQTTDSQPLRSELPRETKRLSRERTQFLFTEEVKAPTNEQSRLPNKVLIPDFNQANNEREIGQVSPVPKVNKIKAEHWITQTSVVEMPQSEPTTSFGRLTYEQTQFLNTEETKETTKEDGNQPGRIPIPDFKQESSAKEVGAISPPPKVQRIKSEQWMTQTTDSQPLRSELPRETKRLSRERTQFLFTEDVKAPTNEQSRLPNKVLIPDFNQANNEREIGQVSPVPKVNKSKAEHWITQTSVVEMPQSEPTTSFGRLTYEQTQFLNTEETKETTKDDGNQPGRIPIPDFKQESSAKEVGAISPPPKVQRIKSEQWMTQTTDSQPLRSELPRETKRLSRERTQFLFTEDVKAPTNEQSRLPNKVLIPDFNQANNEREIGQVSPVPKVNKIKAEHWITQTSVVEMPQSEPTTSFGRLTYEQTQFLNTEETKETTKVDGTGPGRIPIPDFKQESSAKEVGAISPPPKVQRIKSEQWMTQTTDSQPLRSELPRETKRLSRERTQFLFTEDVKAPINEQSRLPNKVLIPDFNQANNEREIGQVSPVPKVNKIKAEHWITQTSVVEMPQSEPTTSFGRLTYEQTQFLNTEETKETTKVDGTGPGRIPIPDFKQESSAKEVGAISPPPKVQRIKSEQWMTQTTDSQPLRSELPRETKRLSRERTQFLFTEEVKAPTNEQSRLPNKVLIPDFNQANNEREIGQVSPVPKVNKIKAEHWITQTSVVEMPQSEPTTSFGRLTYEQTQFLNTEETKETTKEDGNQPGRIPIPDFKQESSAKEVGAISPPPKVQRIKSEQWMTQTTDSQPLRSELPRETKRLSRERTQFLFTEDVKAPTNEQSRLPNKVLIPDFNQANNEREIGQVSPVPKVNKSKAEHWITQTSVVEMPQSEPTTSFGRLTYEQTQFLNTEETKETTKDDGNQPGRIPIPDFKQESSAKEVGAISPPPKVQRIKSEQWMTQTTDSQPLRSELPRETKRLSRERTQFLFTEEVKAPTNEQSRLLNKVLIPDFNQANNEREIGQVSPVPKVNKIKAEHWITQTSVVEMPQSEPTTSFGRLTYEQTQFLNTEETKETTKEDGNQPGRIPIPDFKQESSAKEVGAISPPPKVQRIKSEQWMTQTTDSQPLRSELPRETKRLSRERTQFLFTEEVKAPTNEQSRLPNKVLIPDFNQANNEREIGQVSPVPKVNKIKAEHWITQTSVVEMPQSEPTTSFGRLTYEHTQFLNTEETKETTKEDGNQPGRIPIPDFKQESSAKEVGAISPPPKVQRIKSEQWMTQTTDSQPLRSELPRETKRLSRERTQFLFTEDVKAPTNEQSRLPNKVLIPDFNQANNEREIGQVSPVPKVNKIKAEHWITQTSVVEMPQSEPTTSFGRLTYEQTQFLNTEETKETTKVDGTGPGRIPIPDFKQESSAKEVGAISPPPKVQRIKSEQWMTQTTDSQPLRSELPRETKRLSRERTQFLFTEDVKAPTNEQSRLPNKVLIPDFNQANNEREIGQVSPVPKVNKIKAEHWITQTSVVEMPQSEPTTSFGRLTYEQTQFLNTEETKETTKEDGNQPGRIPIPDFKQESSAKEVGAISPPPKVQRIKSEQWMTQTTDSQPLRSELPRETKRLSGERTQFLFTEDVKAPINEQSRLPNKVLIPDFNQANNEREIGQVSPVPKVNKIKAEHWITQTSVVEMPQSEPTTSFGRLTSEQTQFLNTEETKETTKEDGNQPGRIPIPDFKQESSAKEVGAISPPPKVQRIKSEQWMTQTTDSQPLRSELPRETKRLSRERTQFLFTEKVKAPTKEQGRLPNKVLIPEFNQANNEREIGQVSPVPKVNKIKAEHWITQTSEVKQLQSEPTSSFGKITQRRESQPIGSELPRDRKLLSGERREDFVSEESKVIRRVNGFVPGKVGVSNLKAENSGMEIQLNSRAQKVQKVKPEGWRREVMEGKLLRSERPGEIKSSELLDGRIAESGREAGGSSFLPDVDSVVVVDVGGSYNEATLLSESERVEKESGPQINATRSSREAASGGHVWIRSNVRAFGSAENGEEMDVGQIRKMDVQRTAEGGEKTAYRTLEAWDNEGIGITTGSSRVYSSVLYESNKADCPVNVGQWKTRTIVNGNARSEFPQQLKLYSEGLKSSEPVEVAFVDGDTHGSSIDVGDPSSGQSRSAARANAIDLRGKEVALQTKSLSQPSYQVTETRVVDQHVRGAPQVVRRASDQQTVVVRVPSHSHWVVEMEPSSLAGQ